jgi:hypothetical protein
VSEPPLMKPRRGRLGHSETHRGNPGRALTLDNPLDKGYLCSKICPCAQGTALRSAQGHELKQRCTTASIWREEEQNQLVWRYKAEVGFNMTVNPPAPLMSATQPNRPSRFPLGAALAQGILKRDFEEGKQAGKFRIPDCIILKATGPELAAMRASQNIQWDKLLPIQSNRTSIRWWKSSLMGMSSKELSFLPTEESQAHRKSFAF